MILIKKGKPGHGYSKKSLWKLIIFLIIAISSILSYKFIERNRVNQKNILSGEDKFIGNGQVILELYIWDDEQSYIMPVVEAYNLLQTEAHINVNVLKSDKYDDLMKSYISESGKKIDLFGVRGISQVIQYQETGNLIDLTEYLEDSDIDVTAYGSMFNDITLDGRYYAMPTRSTCWALFYNKDIFDAKKLPYPGQMTWEEYADLAIRLTSGEGEKKIWGGYWVTWCCNFGALQHNSSLLDDDLSHARESLLLLNRFYSIDKSHMPFTEMDGISAECRDMFNNGKIAMMPQGEWMVNMLMEDEKNGVCSVNWDIAPMPVFDGVEEGTTWGQYQFIAISSETEWPKEAFSFLKFLCDKEGARIYARNGMIHAYYDDEIKKIYMSAVERESASIFFESKRIQEQLAFPGYQEILDLYKEYAEMFFNGEISIDEAMEKFNDGRINILKK
jgi:multiple sugar transport system substrate-binding protein